MVWKSLFVALSAPALLAACKPAVALLESDDQDIATTAPAQKLTGRIVDDADIIPADIEQSLINRLAAIETDTLAQVVVVTTVTLNGSSIEEYTTTLANAWGVGAKDRDDGVILLVAPNDRKVRIGVGYGLEATLTDEISAEIIDEMLNHFRVNDYPAGIGTGVDGIEKTLRKELERTS